MLAHLFQGFSRLLPLLLLGSDIQVQAAIHFGSILDMSSSARTCANPASFERIQFTADGFSRVCVARGGCSRRALLQRSTQKYGKTVKEYFFAKQPTEQQDYDREVHTLKIMQGNKYFPRIECLMPADVSLDELKVATLQVAQPIEESKGGGSSPSRWKSFRSTLKRLSHRSSSKTSTSSSSSSALRVLVLKLVNSRDALSWLQMKLHRWPDEGAETVLQLMDVLIQFTEAVSQLHQRGLIHNDLKPGNLLVKDDQVGFYDFLPNGKPDEKLSVEIQLVDFGSASSVHEPVESAMLVSRTPEFVAPELKRQIDGIQRGALPRQKGTVQSDVYSVGKTMQVMFDMAKRLVQIPTVFVIWFEKVYNSMLVLEPEERLSLSQARSILKQWKRDYAKSTRTP